MLDFIDERAEKQEEEEQEEEEEEEVEEEKVEEENADSDEEEPDKTATNSLLSVGYVVKLDLILCRYSSDRSFVVRGSQIGVFKPQDNKLKYCTRIKKLKDSEGKTFSPSKVRFVT